MPTPGSAKRLAARVVHDAVHAAVTIGLKERKAAAGDTLFN
jgi:hypothetical protein